jgi:hypothetical protein
MSLPKEIPSEGDVNGGIFGETQHWRFFGETQQIWRFFGETQQIWRFFGETHRQNAFLIGTYLKIEAFFFKNNCVICEI